MTSFLHEVMGEVPSAETAVRVAVRLLVSAAIGSIIGIQREHTGKAAGLRTHMLVALGSTVFVLVAVEVGSVDNVGRVIQGVAAGIGFLGGGAILKLAAEREVHGLTTAAGIWMTAAAGVAVGVGQVVLAVLGVILAWIILAVIGRAEAELENRPTSRRREEKPPPHSE
jgi:putative Mg2+ transporter-C (MgtC) family protein